MFSFRCLVHTVSCVSRKKWVIALRIEDFSSEPMRSWANQLSTKRADKWPKKVLKLSKSELPWINIGPKNIGGLFVPFRTKAKFLYTETVTYIRPRLYVLSSPNTLPDVRLKQKALTSSSCRLLYSTTDGTVPCWIVTVCTKSSVATIEHTVCTSSTFAVARFRDGASGWQRTLRRQFLVSESRTMTDARHTRWAVAWCTQHSEVVRLRAAWIVKQ